MIKIEKLEGVRVIRCDGSIKCRQQATFAVTDPDNRRRLYCLPHTRDAADEAINVEAKSKA
jgi:hypothetical protein